MNSCAKVLVLIVLLPGAALAAAADDARSMALFETKVRPVLVKHCYECHSVESGKSKGGLRLDTRESIRRGGESGPAVIPGDPAKSLLLSAIKHTDPDLEMPPRKPKLADAVIADIEAWIRAGAPDSRESAAGNASRPPVDIAAGREFWSYRKPEWPKNRAGGIDELIREKLRASGLQPAPQAAAGVLLRRLSLDLVGLPPAPDLVSKFEAAASLQAYEQVVDELLASPRFGERWGRHWLDVARFAESNGRESNLLYPHAWRYRDYVIDTANADVPFNRFIMEQLAGDLLPAANAGERARLLIATGFLALGAKGLNEMNKDQFAADVADEQLDAVTRAFMASSIACARCHDHKTDPFSMEDYYSLAGIFKSTDTRFGTWIDSENNNGSHLIELPHLPDQLIPNKGLPPERVKQLKAERAKLDEEEKAQREFALKARLEGRDISDQAYEMLRTAIRIYWTRGGIDGQLETVSAEGHALPLCMGVQDASQPHDSDLFERGEIAHPVKTVARGFPRVLPPGERVPANQSGRLQLARWIASPDNPLTARVMANRIWRHLFGTGIVRTVDNFGSSGERPSHPELLDYLALRFVQHGWSVKKLIKEVVMSETYRQSHQESEQAKANDPDNRQLSHASRRRLDAEAIRDSMLQIAGALDTSRRPGSLVASLSGQSVSLVGFNASLPRDLDGSNWRSVYLPVMRDYLPDVLEQFDVANPNLVTGDRDVTNVPLQALYLLNGTFVHQQARALAARLKRDTASLDQRIDLSFRLCFNRPPDDAERALATAFFGIDGQNDDALLAAYCQSLFASAEFRMVD